MEAGSDCHSGPTSMNARAHASAAADSLHLAIEKLDASFTIASTKMARAGSPNKCGIAWFAARFRNVAGALGAAGADIWAIDLQMDEDQLL